LSTRSYVNTVKKAREKGYLVTVLYFWLNSPDLAVERVRIRVKEGGHHIPEETIRRRYDLGIKNMFNLYIPIVDFWMFIDNSKTPFEILAEGQENKEVVNNELIWNKLKNKYYEQ
jgi:predicted ABC-type ATPase